MINPLASNGIWTTHVGNWDVWVNYPQRNFWTVADINTKYLAPDVWILFSIHLSHWDHVTYASFMISDTTQPRLSCILVIISSMHSTSNVASVTANCKNKWKQFYLTLQVDVAHWQSRPYMFMALCKSFRPIQFLDLERRQYWDKLLLSPLSSCIFSRRWYRPLSVDVAT